MTLLAGEEEFLVEEALQAFLADALPPASRAMDLDLLDGAEADGRDIALRASSFPMAGERRVVVVRSADKLSASDGEILAAYVRAPSPSSSLVLVAAKPDMRRKLFAAVKSAGLVREFRRPGEEQLPAWIAERASRAGRRIEPEAAKLLAATVGASLGALASEVEKLLLYAGERTEIRVADVAALAGASRSYTVFDLQKAVGRRDGARALRILEEMLDDGAGVPLIIATLTGYFLTLWKLHALARERLSRSEMASRARVPPFFLAEYIEALGRHGEAACEQAFLDLAEADERSKSGAAGPHDVMCELVLRLSGAGNRT